jgi:D-3-phosphoglycerate dehydrogenase
VAAAQPGSRFHILVADPIHPAGWEILKAAEGVTCSGPYPSIKALLEAAKQFTHNSGVKIPSLAMIVRSQTQVDRSLLEAVPHLKVFARVGASLDSVDMDAATRLGILVINSPDANLISVAEYTFALLLAIARHIRDGAESARSGAWSAEGLSGFLLHGKTIGIIGYGRLGREVAARAQAFGMHVLAYDPYVDLAFAQSAGVEMVNFAELLERADIVSLHTAYTEQTKTMLNRQAFDRMKLGAVLINCVHPGLVDERALCEALDSDRLAGAALDALSSEPPPPDHPLLRQAKALVLPRLNQNTGESQAAAARQVTADVLDALNGTDFRHVVNLPFSDAVTYKTVKPYIHLASKLGKLQGQLAEGWINRIEVEVLGEKLQDLVRPVTAVLLSGMLLPVDGRAVNWVSAPVCAYEQGIVMAQAKGLVHLADYPNLIACRIYWEGGQRTVAGVLFGNGEARLVQYDQFHVDAYPEGYVLILENKDIPGVIGKVGTRLGQAGINIAQWRYGREVLGGQAVSFINLDSRIPKSILEELEKEPEIQRARLVRL